MTATAPEAVFEHVDDLHRLIEAQPDRARFLCVPFRRYLMIDGTDEPGSEGFQAAIRTLYPVAYTLHFALKRRGVEAPVGMLEALFWLDRPGPLPPDVLAGAPETRLAWNWRLLIAVPDEAEAAEIDEAVVEVRRKGQAPRIDALRVEGWEEGESAQIMHIGPYEAEPETIARLQAAIAEAGCRPRGCHHEIYLSDPARVGPDRLKTVIRQPVEEAGL